jgi:hypothetical protein
VDQIQVRLSIVATRGRFVLNHPMKTGRDGKI